MSSPNDERHEPNDGRSDSGHRDDHPEPDTSSVFAPPSTPTPPASQRRVPRFMAAAIAILAVGIALVTGRIVATRDDSSDRTPGATTETAAALEVTAPEGFKLVKSNKPEFEIAIAIPEAWREFDLAKHDIDTIQSSLEQEDPRLVAALDQVKQVSEVGGVLFAIEPRGGPFSHNLNVVRIAEELDVDVARRTFAQQLRRAGVERLRFKKIDIPAGEALRGTYELAHPLPGGKAQRVQVRQYYVPTRNATWIVTFSTIDIANDTKTFDRVIASFRVAGS